MRRNLYQIACRIDSRKLTCSFRDMNESLIQKGRNDDHSFKSIFEFNLRFLDSFDLNSSLNSLFFLRGRCATVPHVDTAFHWHLGGRTNGCATHLVTWSERVRGLSHHQHLSAFVMELHLKQ